MMADPLTAIGLAGNIIQFVTFCGSLVSKSQEIQKSSDGTLVEYLKLEAITTHLKKLTDGMTTDFGPEEMSDAETQLEDLCQDCRIAAQDLLQAINGLKAQGKSNQWKSFKQALRSVWNEDRIKKLAERLEGFRRQIDTTTLVLLREQIARGYSEQSRHLNRLDGAISQLDKSNKQWQADFLNVLRHKDWNPRKERDRQAFAMHLSSAVDQDRRENAASIIMHQLDFYERSSRYEKIHDAYAETFDWMYQKSETAYLVGGKSYWHSFADWLESDGSVYWVTGKPGSGKSTLMKFIDNHPRTLECVQCWKPEYKLIRAGWFFWNSGTPMQMSRKGLLQALLYQCLQQLPDDLPEVFSRRWKNHELYGNDLQTLEWPELTSAFRILIERGRSTRRFLFIIDGLDEFDGQVSDLINWITDIASFPNVKICVASRPWLAFEEAFASRPHLELQYLTFDDIKRYISEKLLENPIFARWHRRNEAEAAEIIDRIIEKASGVFLWVYLVVSSILSGLRDGDKLGDLRKRIEELPSELDQLFRKILDNLDKRHFEQASQLIQIMKATQQQMSVLNLAFAEEGLEAALEAEHRTLTYDELDEILDTARRRIRSRCKGLLEIYYDRVNNDHGSTNFTQTGMSGMELRDEGGEVTFLHRTVKDFLNREDIWNYIISGTDDCFNSHLALGSMCVRQLKILPWSDHDSGIMDTTRRRIVENCMLYTKSAQESSATSTIWLLNELDIVCSTVANMDGTAARVVWDHPFITSGLKSPHTRHWSAYPRERSVEACPSVFYYALQYKLYHYFDWRLGQEHLVNHTVDGHSLLSHAINTMDQELLCIVLKHGAHPNEPERYGIGNRSPWYCLLLKSRWQWHWKTQDWLMIQTAIKKKKYRPEDDSILQNLSQIFQLMLQYGADPWIELPSLPGRGCLQCSRTIQAQIFLADDWIRIIFADWSKEMTKRLLDLLDDKRGRDTAALGLKLSHGLLCDQCYHKGQSGDHVPNTQSEPSQGSAPSEGQATRYQMQISMSTSNDPLMSARNPASTRKKHRLSRRLKSLFSSSS